MSIFSDAHTARNSYNHIATSIARIWHLCHSNKHDDMVYMETKQRNRQTTRGSQGMEPEIHGSTGGQDQRSGYNNQGNGEHEKHIKQRELEFLRQKDRIQSLKTDIEDFIYSNFGERGEVLSLPRLFEITFNVYPGWFLKLVYADETRDIYHVNAEQDNTLPWHSHHSNEYIQILSGGIRLLVEEENGGIDKQILQDGDSAVIEKDKKHLISPLSKTKMVVTFEPPISTDV